MINRLALVLISLSFIAQTSLALADTTTNLPDIETLHAESDFSPFLSRSVSKKLRKQAMKKLFFSGKFTLRDGLDTYDDDYTYFEPLGNTISSDMKFRQRRTAKPSIANS